MAARQLLEFVDRQQRKSSGALKPEIRRGHQPIFNGSGGVSMSGKMGSPIVILVSPIKTSPGRFEARLASTAELLVRTSRQPFVDAARVLMEKGCDPTAMLEMKHAGRGIVALRGPLLKAARLSVEEGVNGPRFVPFRKGLKPCVDALPSGFGTMAEANTPANNSRSSEPATQHDNCAARSRPTPSSSPAASTSLPLTSPSPTPSSSIRTFGSRIVEEGPRASPRRDASPFGAALDIVADDDRGGQ
jgi:hypothetical protein